jgi:ABC-2 type transport system ATP-binding protein
MSISISQLSKKYGSQLALDHVSFEAQKGQITGFLGPNGAGKSTTMKIITGYVPASSGSVSVLGMDVFQNKIQAQKKIGYLPEHNPLYLDMYVHEYLAFVASIYHLPNVKNKVAQMVEKVGLTREQNKKIGTLSKGYRQRVGLAQALIHDPEVLILDEPLTGLDPNQIVEIRQLIKELGADKTVVFSTHIMQEVQYLCDKVVIINKGKIVADKSLAELKTSDQGRKTVHLELERPFEPSSLQAMLGVEEVVVLSANQARVHYSVDIDIRPELFRWANENGNSLLSLKAEEDSLESIFQKLTRESN